jgi:branched-chain amino acid transport system substrate-binding protein
MKERNAALLKRAVTVGAAVAMLAAMNGTAVSAKAKKTTKKKVAAKTTAKTTLKATPAPGQQGNAPAANKGTVKIGMFGVSVSTTTGVRTLEETRKVGTAWETQVNKAGGINGYKVNVIYKDTNGDSARALAAVKDMDKQGVVTMAGHGDSTGLLAMLDYMKQKSLPLVGGSALDVSWETHPMLFNVGASYYAAIYGSPYGVKALGAKNYRRVYCTESPACVNSVPLGNRAAVALGMKGSAEGASAVAVDYTSNCLNAKNADIDALHIAGVNAVNLVRDCARQNYHPIYAQTVTTNFQATIDALKGERFAGPIQEFPAWYNGPEVADFKAAMRTTDLKEGDYGQASVQAWLGLETVKAALMKLTAPNPSRAQFVQALCSLKDETLGGQTNAMDYTGQCNGGRHSNNDCWFNDFVDDGQFKLLNAKGGVAKTIAEAVHCGTDTKGLPTS